MTHEAIQTSRAPAAIGPYSQAVSAAPGAFLFLSGQIPIDPETGALETGDIEQQTHRVMKNLGAVLDAGGAGFGDVMKTTIFLVDMNDFATVNRVYESYFPEGGAYPARATVEVSGLPKGVSVEIDCIARKAT